MSISYFGCLVSYLTFGSSCMLRSISAHPLQAWLVQKCTRHILTSLWSKCRLCTCQTALSIRASAERVILQLAQVRFNVSQL